MIILINTNVTKIKLQMETGILEDYCESHTDNGDILFLFRCRDGVMEFVRRKLINNT